jgi:tryptophan synthase beta chain
MAAKMGFQCTIYMGEIDYNRQRPNVLWMEMLGAEVVAVKHGTRILKDAITAALQDWISSCDESYYVMGTAAGPHPFPSMVADFQSIIGIEIQQQLQEIYGIAQPDICVACVGGGCNSLGSFRAFLDKKSVQLIGVEAGGTNAKKIGEHAVRFQ